VPITLNTSVLVNAKIEHGTFELDATGLSTVRDLLARADREKLMGRRFFKRLLGRGKRNALTLLHNGRRLDIPGDLGRPVADGDEVSLLMPLVGG